MVAGMMTKVQIALRVIEMKIIQPMVKRGLKSETIRVRKPVPTVTALEAIALPEKLTVSETASLKLIP